ncbi:MAG: 30S ribosomal protein S21 [Anaerolineaceae bacterium]|nr:30S ribosomal protein S21 [Anaerolineaceae bacterium]
MATTVKLRPNESQQDLLKRFRKKVTRSGSLSALRRKRWFVSKTEQRRVDRKKAIRRMKQKQRKQQQKRY